MSEPILSLYATLRDRFGLVPLSALEVYRVGAVSAEDAELLEVASGSPAFIVQRTTSDARTVRVHSLDDARRPVRDPLQAPHVTTGKGAAP